MKYLISVLLFMMGFQLGAQSIHELIKKADEYGEEGAYEQAAKTYDLAIARHGGIADDYVESGKYWARSSSKDKAMERLVQAAAAGWMDTHLLEHDTALLTLQSHPQWDSLALLVASNVKSNDDLVDKDLSYELRYFGQRHRTMRRLVLTLADREGLPDAQRHHFDNIAHLQDSTALAAVESILNTQGWPSQSMVGIQANHAVFTIISHAPLDVQQRYKPLLEASVEEGGTPGILLAKLEDMILVKQGKPQRYGTQVRQLEDGTYEVAALIDPMDVDERRSTLGLGTLKEALLPWGIKWPVK